MSYFHVKPGDMKNIALKQEEIIRKLSEAESELRQISNRLQSNPTLSRAVTGRLRSNLSAITDKRQAMNSIRKALNEIVALYERTEQAILKNGGDADMKRTLLYAGGLLGQASAALGMQRCGAYSADPVNLNTGNYVYEKTFLTLDAQLPLSFSVFYNVQGTFAGALGRGWIHSYEIRVKRLEGGGASLLTADGSEKTFLRDEDTGAFRPEPGTFGSLVVADDRFIVAEPNGNRLVFDDNGRFLEERDRNGNCITAAYDDEGKLLSVTGSRGDFFSFSYNSDGELSAVEDSAGRSLRIVLEYGIVAEIGSETLGITRYTYDLEDRLCAVTNPRGICSLDNSFDEKSRTVSQIFPDGGRVSYVYDEVENKTTLREQNGNEISYIHDKRFRNTATIYANGEERFAYNDDNLPLRFTDRLGRSTVFDYDAQGSLTRMENAKGDSFSAVYGPFAMPSEISVNGKWLYRAEYDDRGNQTSLTDALHRKTNFAYDESGCLTSLIQPDGSAYILEYDGRGDLVSVLTPFGGRELYEYDAAHRVICSTDSCGNTTAFTYNDRGDIISAKNAAGDVCYYEYDKCGNLTRHADFDGSVTLAEYNELNLPSVITNPNGQSTRFEYDEMWQLVRRTEPDNGVTSYEYDALHRLVKLTDPEGKEVLFTHDAVGNVVSRTESDGSVYEAEYDELDRPVRIKDPAGAVTKADYTPLGEISCVTDAAGSRFLREFDDMGQLICETAPEVGELHYSYNALGLIESVSDAKGVRCRYTYLPGGLLETEESEDGSFFRYEYDAVGNVTSLTNRDGGVWRIGYDSLYRIIEVSSDLGQRDSYEYDAVGNITACTNALGERTEYTYSPTGKLTSVRDAMGVYTYYSYDAMDMLEAVIRPETGELDAAALNAMNARQQGIRVSSCSRDLMGNIRSQIDALGCETRFTYGKNGMLESVLDADGNLTSFEYNADRTRKSILYADGKSVKLSYNSLKQLTELEDWLGVTRIQRDPLGRVTEIANSNGDTVGYKWGCRDELLSIASPCGVTAYEYDEAMRLVRCTADGRDTEYSYLQNGLLREKRLPDGLTAGYGYDILGRLSSLVTNDAAGVLDEFSYSYDAAGRKSCVERRCAGKLGGKLEYTYDKLGSLETVTKDGSLLCRYEYDAFGNRSRMEAPEGVTSYAYNAMNQLVSLSGPAGESSFDYDRRGNMIRQSPAGAPALELTFDPRNRLSLALRGDRRREYTYNAFGQRVGSAVSDAAGTAILSTSFLRDPLRAFDNLLRQTENGADTDFFYGGELLFSKTGGERQYYLHNELGSPIRASRGGGPAVGLGFDEFGLPLGDAPALSLGFAGYAPDSITGLCFAQQREYAPGLGRFISPDRIPGFVLVPLSLNPYLYCRNDPLNMEDRTGDSLSVLGGGLVGVAVSLCTKLGGDIVSGNFSSWESYVGAAAGGFVKGSVFVATAAASGGNLKLAGTVAGAAGGATEALVGGGLEMLTGKREADGMALLKETAKGAVMGAAEGFAFGAVSIKIKGITAGIGSFDSVFRAGITKAIRYGYDMSGKVIAKGIVAQGIVGGLLGTIYKKGKERLHDVAKKIGTGMLRKGGDYIKDQIERKRGSAVCPLEGSPPVLAAV